MIVVHLGAHRTATTLFQKTLADNRQRLSERGICFLGPEQIRNGDFQGLMIHHSHVTLWRSRKAQTAAQKLRSTLDSERRAGRRVILSEENILGNIRSNVDTMSIYPNIQSSLERLQPAFEQVDVFYISIRPLDVWWNSCLSFAIRHFRRPPSAMQLDCIAYNSAGGWRTVRQAVCDAFPKAKVKVVEFGALTAKPIVQLAEVSGWQDLSHLEQKHQILNRSKTIKNLKEILEGRGDSIGIARLAEKGEGRKLNMFSDTGLGMLFEAYERDLAWLRCKTDDRITFLEAPK